MKLWKLTQNPTRRVMSQSVSPRDSLVTGGAHQEVCCQGARLGERPGARQGPQGLGAPWGEQGELSEGQVVEAGLHQALFSAGVTPRVPGHLARLAGGPGPHLPGSGFPLPPPTWAACLGHSPEHFCSCSALAISTPKWGVGKPPLPRCLGG